MRRAAIANTIGVLTLVLAGCGADSVSPSLIDAPNGTTGCSSEQLADDSGELTGAWEADDGGTYYLRQMGDCVWWFGTELEEVWAGETEQPGFANVAVGHVSGNEVRLEWADIPLGDILGGGTLVLQIGDDGNQLTKSSETGTGFGGVTWRRLAVVSSESVALLESGFDACALLDVADVEAVTGRSVSEASEHLTGVPLEDIRDCVFFGQRVGDTMAGIAGLSVRQVATSAAEGEALLAELAEGYPSGEVVGGHLADGVPDLEIRHCDPGNACSSWLAFSAEPYFIIVRAGDIGEAETLAHAVLQRLSGN